MQLFSSPRLLTKILIALAAFPTWAIAKPFDLVTNEKKVSIFFDRECALDSIAAGLLASDIERISGYHPVTSADITLARGNVILIGSLQSEMMHKFESKINLEKLKGKWECYSYRILSKPSKV